ncbi:hypothetical protein BV25DRAFT_1696706 [Artomyces pyxidatus]|uniref:Uncharacterized protein n=1 Tax=Artomyces pyxidatus TaxID=48021 RepID=A0ACB8TBC5_9AGAM|nr:hypothetical protein BV25DRAFT_1696706 [Artomyces pyxidatus]
MGPSLRPCSPAGLPWSRTPSHLIPVVHPPGLCMPFLYLGNLVVLTVFTLGTDLPRTVRFCSCSILTSVFCLPSSVLPPSLTAAHAASVVTLSSLALYGPYVSDVCEPASLRVTLAIRSRDLFPQIFSASVLYAPTRLTLHAFSSLSSPVPLHAQIARQILRLKLSGYPFLCQIQRHLKIPFRI